MIPLKKSLQYWERYGQHLLIATDYKDPVIHRALGCEIEDIDGNSFIDLESGQICALLGHQHPKYIEKMIAQIETLMHVGTAFMSPPVLEAAQRINKISPPTLTKSIILSTGAEANECAFRIAKIYTGKQGIVGFHKGYAGLTLATMNAGGNTQNSSLELPGAFKLLAPDCLHCAVASTFPECDFLCLKVSAELLAVHCLDSVAAFIVEPILSAGGMIFPPPGYFQRLKDVAASFNALLIADEAQTGMGRTGRWFGLDHDAVEPDILVLSKGVGGGFPASAVVVSEIIADTIMAEFSNFSSHQSDPISAAAISTVIDIIQDEGLVANAAETGTYFKSNLDLLSQRHSIIANVRGKGLMIGFDAQGLPDNGLSQEQVGLIFESICRQLGVHLKSIHSGKTFRLLPPLSISKQEIDKIIVVFDDAMKRIRRGNYQQNLTTPKNRYAKKYAEQRSNKLTFKKIIQKSLETPPERLISKISRKLNKR